MKIRASIIGATGYAGAELLRILLAHPQAEVAGLSSVSFEGKAISDVYPAFRAICEQACGTREQAVEAGDVVFAALPHGLSQELAAECYEKGKVFIDLGADFRLESAEEYQEWYGCEFISRELHEKSVYALPELFRRDISRDKILANPGCYPTSAALGLFPALKKGLVSPEGIVIDSKSGATGAGRGLSQTTHFCECNEGFAPYKVAQHRHTPEIEQTLSKAAGKALRVTFVPHLLPVNRGIVSTMYARLNGGADEEAIRAVYEEWYRGEPFIRLLPKGQAANLRSVRCSNYCDISLHPDFRTGTLVVVSAIDNMVKGAAGQAVQNMNICFGLPETMGLDMIPPAF